MVAPQGFHAKKLEVMVPESSRHLERFSGRSLIVCTRSADVIIGPIGIVIADSLLGEVTPQMAAAIGSSPVRKILLPVNKCNNIIVGTADKSTSVLIAEAIRRVQENC